MTIVVPPIAMDMSGLNWQTGETLSMIEPAHFDILGQWFIHYTVF